MANPTNPFRRVRLVFRRSSPLLKCVVLTCIVLAIVALLVIGAAIRKTQDAREADRARAAQKEQENAQMEQINAQKGTIEWVKRIAQDKLGLLQLLVPMEKWKRDALIGELSQWVQLLHSAMLCRAGVQVPMNLARQLSAQRSPEELMAAINTLKKVIEYAQGNVSPGAICGHLVWALR